jgi:hypothetical protein
MTKKKERDIEKTYTTKQVVAKLRRLADSLENGKQYKIQIAGEKISIPTKGRSRIPIQMGTMSLRLDRVILKIYLYRVR